MSGLGEWDGSGLPPVAAERVRRAGEVGLHTSLLSAPAALTLAEVGFEPVGDAMGCAVIQIAWRGAGCGTTYAGMNTRTVVSGDNNRWSGSAPYTTALTTGWNSAFSRMQLEAAALGADGVVGVRMHRTQIDSGVFEFLAQGTAVRGRSRTRAVRPFLTECDGPDLAKLLHAGWVPTGIAVGISVGVRHHWAMAWGLGNVELVPYTDLVNRTRADAREQLLRRAAAIGGDAVTVSRTSLRVWDHEVGEGHRDDYAEAIFVGNVVARFGSRVRTPSLSVLPLKGARSEGAR